MAAASTSIGRRGQGRALPGVAADRHGPPHGSADRGFSGNNLAGKHILLVDDGIDMVESLAGLLGMEGAVVATADNGQAALALAQQAGAPYNLMLSDIGMPGMDGHALPAELRKLPATATTPAIALSGFTGPKDVDVALAAGFDSHVRKPVAFDQFIVLARRICA